MKILIIILSTFIALTISGQNTIDIKTVGDKIQLELRQDGKLYSKSYNSWKEIKGDPRLKNFTNHFIDSSGLKTIAEGLQFDLSEGISIEFEDVDISVLSDSKNDVLEISISSDKGKKRKKN